MSLHILHALFEAFHVVLHVIVHSSILTVKHIANDFKEITKVVLSEKILNR